MIRVFLFLYLFLHPQAVAPQPAAQAKVLLQSGIDAENRHDIDHALVEFRKAAELDPASSEVLLRLGDAYMKKHDAADAIPPLKRAVELSPDSIPIHQLLGYALLAQGFAAEAIPHLEVARDPAALGIAHLENDEPAKAVVNLQSALENDPDNVDLLFYVSRAAAALGSQSTDKLLSAFPNSARAHQTRGQGYYQTKMIPEAGKEYEQAIAIRPDLPGLHLELGEIYAGRAEWPKAEEQFRVETKLQPGSAEAAFRLGDALVQEGKMKEAADELRRSDSLHPNMPETLYAMGRALAAADASAAEQALTSVLKLEQNSSLAAQADLLLASIHRKQGKSELASREMEDYHRIQGLKSQ
ncbi:MAG: tetratricopeptide repeat protein [Candidatus Sulfotelmatobacter sp.]